MKAVEVSFDAWQKWASINRSLRNRANDFI